MAGNAMGGAAGTAGAANDGAAAAVGTAGAGGGAGAAGTGSGGAGGGGVGGMEADAGCISANAQGFAFNPACGDAGQAAACRAACTLNGDRYTGCVSDSPVASYCYPSCAACP